MQEELIELLKNFAKGIVMARTVEDVLNRAVNYIESLEAENAKLIAERDMLNLCADQNEDEVKKIHAELKESAFTVCALRAEIDEYQAEREAMMKQEPVAYEVTDEVRGNKWVTTIQNPEKYVKDYPELKLMPLLAGPLPAQHIPDTPHYLTGSYKTRSSNSLIGVIHAVRKCNGDNFNYSLCGKKPRPKSMGWHETRSEITCDKCKAMLSASQPKGDVWIEIPKFLRRGDD